MKNQFEIIYRSNSQRTIELKSPRFQEPCLNKFENADVIHNNKGYNIVSHPTKDLYVTPNSFLNNINKINFTDSKLNGKSVKQSKKEIK